MNKRMHLVCGISDWDLLRIAKHGIEVDIYQTESTISRLGDLDTTGKREQYNRYLLDLLSLEWKLSRIDKAIDEMEAQA